MRQLCPVLRLTLSSIPQLSWPKLLLLLRTLLPLAISRIRRKSARFARSYFLTVVDDDTRYTWTFLMKNKSDALKIIPRFFAYVDTQFGTPIKCFRSDNALELSFTDAFGSRGVLHQFSCVECPEQNSVVEQKHQHLLNVARRSCFSLAYQYNSGGIVF